MADNKKPWEKDYSKPVINKKPWEKDYTSSDVKKKVDSKPRSQEELWGSESQPQDLYTSLVTGAQEPQQESDGLGGPPSPPVKKKPSVLFPETPMGRPASSVMYETKQPVLVESTPFEAKPNKYYRMVSDEKKAVEQQLSDLEERNTRLGRRPEDLTTEGTYQALQKQKAQLDQEFEPAQTAIKQIQRQAAETNQPFERIVYGATDGKYSYFTTDIINLNKDVEDKIIDRFDDAPEETKKKWYKGALPVEAKEAIINSAKNEVLTDKYNILKKDADNYIKNIKDNPAIPLEEKLKFQKEFKDSSDAFNSQIALDYSGKLLKNNFKITDANKGMDEAILSKYKGFIPDTVDVLSTFAEGMGQVGAKVATGIPSLALIGAERFNQLTGISKPEDYTAIEATEDWINDTTNLNFLPSSQTKRGNIVVDGEFNPSYYSMTKTLAKTLPFTLKIMSDVKKGRIDGTPQSMISQLINPKYSKDFADKLRVVETAYKGTISDNYREAKEMGMDDSKSFLYANTMSLAEGVSENIMPDYKYFDSLTGSALKSAFKGNLKQAVTKQAAKNVTKDFFKNFVLETGEEEVILATEDALKYSLLLNHQNSEFFNMSRQKELVATTALLSGALGTVSTNQKFKQNKKDLYNSIHSNIYNLQDAFLDEIDSPLNDQKAKEALITAYKFANDVSVAVSNAPENVTADQIDLLVQKKNLEEKKKTIDTAFHPDINEEITAIDTKIRELAKMPVVEEPAVKEVVVEEPAVEEVKPTEVKPSGQKVTDVINRPATLESQAGVKLETPIDGDVYQEGQRVIFEDKNKKVYDLGNIDEISDKTVEELGIKPQEEMVSVTPEGKVKVGENEWNMQSDLPNYGIEYDNDGNVKAVSLKDDAGKTVMYEGQVAEDAAYQVLLKQTETPEQRQAINEILENDEELNRQLREAEEATEATAAEVTEPGAPKTQAEQYSEELDKTKESDPEAYWSVSPVSAADAAKGTIIDTPDGAAIVKPDGDIAGLFKKATSKAKGVAQDLLKRAIAAGGKKLDNYDTYLTPQYIKAGFRVVSRTPFNEEYAPPGWNKELHGTPDVVAMVYDPENKLDIEEKTFNDPNTGYDEAIAYRDSLLEIDAELEGLAKLFDESDKGFRMSQVDNAKEALKGILPGVKFIVHETNEAYNKAVGDSSSGTYIMYANGDRIIHINKKNANGRTVAHEVFHAVILDKIKNIKSVQEITARMVDAVYKTASPELRAKLDAFAAMYSDKTIRDEERLAELIGIIADGYPQMSPANKSIVKRWLDALAKAFGLKPFTDNEVIDLLNILARKVSTGEVISAEDVAILNNINELNSKSEGSSGDQMNAAIIDRKQIKDSLDNSFKLIEYDDTNLPDNIKMPNRSTVESVIDKSGGAAIFINSDGTKVGIRKNNTPLHGGWRYTYLVENQKDNIGFAATSSTHVKNMHGLAVKLADVRDSENEKAKGKPIAVFVTIQNADTMLGEWYTGEFFMEGIDKAINNNAFKGGVNTAKKLLIDALTYKSQIENLKKKIKEKKESLLTAKDKDKINSQIDKLKDQVKNKLEVSKKADNNRFINLINSENFNTHDGRIKIAKELSSKKFSFGYRVKLLKQLIPLKSATGSNKEIKKALLDVNNGRVDFYNEHLDEVLLNKMKETNYDETSIGGISLGGFFMDPYMSFDNFYNNRKNGIKHAQFNESFTSNGDTFSLDSVINVNKLAPEMGYPTNKGYELYNSSNKTNFTKKNTTLNDRFKIANFLYKETNNNSKYLTPPFTSIGGSMYTSTVFDQKTTEEKTIIRKQIVGENANLSQNVRDNLDIARDMESSKKSDKEIRLATGWERGADKKWRYEVPDFKFKKVLLGKYDTETPLKNVIETALTGGLEQYNLEKILSNDELFNLYPDLKKVSIAITNSYKSGFQQMLPKGVDAAVFTDYGVKTIAVKPTKNIDLLETTIAHEIQHIIQEKEGFSVGEDFNKVGEEKYVKSAGEVESRNVEKRMVMTPEERRKTTLQETEDVAREDQIIFFKRSQLQEPVKGSEVWKHIEDITPYEEDIPGGFKKDIIDRTFKNVDDFDMKSLLKTDPDFKDYYEGGETRYDEDEVSPRDLLNEIVVVDGTLLDGYSRVSILLRNGEKTTNAYVAEIKRSQLEITKKLQQAKSIDEMVRIAKEAKYSDAAISSFLKAKGFNVDEITKAVLGYNKKNIETRQKEEGIFTRDGKNKVLNSLSSFKRKFLSARSFLGRSTFIAKEGIEAGIKAQSKIASYLVSDLDNAIKKYDGDKEKIISDFDRFIRGESVSLPDNFLEIGNAMRAHIDKLSYELINSGVVDQAENIKKNIGTYLTRSYEVFDKKDWAKMVDEETLQAARNFLKKQLLSEATKEAKASGLDVDLILEKKVDQAITDLINREGAQSFVASGKTGSKDMSILKQKTDIPLEIRALMGEYTDPAQNYSRTIFKVASLINNAKFLNTVRNNGIGVYLFEKNDINRPKEFDTLIAAEGSETMNPLNGLYTTKEIAESLKESAGILNAIEVALPYSISGTVKSTYEYYMKLLGGVKWLKTIASVGTHFKNVSGNVTFMLANGYFKPDAYRQSAKAIYNDFLKKTDQELRDKMQEYIEAGIIDQSAVLGELRSMFKEEDFDKSFERRMNSEKLNSTNRFIDRVKRLGKKGAELAQNAYQAEDDYFKIVSYETEKNRYAKAMFRNDYSKLSEDEQGEVRDRVTEITKNVLPNYGRVPGAVKLVKAFPVVGTFISFQTEALRTAYNIVNLSVTELKSSNPEIKKIGALRMSGIIASQAIKYGVMYLIGGSMLGDDDDEKKENAKRFVAPWSKNSNVLITKEGDGKFSYIDFSASDPFGGIVKPLNAAMQGEDLLDGFIQGTKELVSPFTNPDILKSMFTEISENKDSYGNQLYNPSDTFEVKSSAILSRVYKTFEPGTATSIRKISKSDSPLNEMAGQFTGYKENDIDLTKQFSFKISDMKKMEVETRNIYNRAFRKFENKEITDAELEAAYNQSNKATIDTYKELKKDYDAAIFFGTEYKDLKDEMKRSKVSKDVIRGITTGDFKDLKKKEGIETDAQLKARNPRVFAKIMAFRERRKKAQ